MNEFVKINIKPDTREKLNKLSKLHQRRMYIFLNDAVNFFDRTGFDPLECEVQSPAEEMKKLRNSLVSFIRKQEKDLLIPMVDRVDEMVKTMAILLNSNAPTSAKDYSISKAKIDKKAGGLKIPDGALSDKDRLDHIETSDSRIDSIAEKYKGLIAKVSQVSSSGNKKFIIDITEEEYHNLMEDL